MKAKKNPPNATGKVRSVFSGTDKEKIVEEIESERLSVQEAIVRYGVAGATLKRWVRTYGQGETIAGPLLRLTAMQQRQIIAEIETGNLTTLEALKKYKISESTFYNWRKKYSNDIVGIKAADNMKKNEEYTPSVPESKHLEELRLKIIALETMIDIAEKEFNIPIRKKCGSKQ
jgi:transposase-like protein